MDYRALHEQFKSEGLYQCNYSAYAWESLRYLALFAAFGYFLHIKWYITSATFLGLFWVSFITHAPNAEVLIYQIATNHVHGSRRRPPRHHRKLCV
jgi:delta8-fatty-acid desaturase